MGAKASGVAGEVVPRRRPRTASIAARGIQDGDDLFEYLTALVCDANDGLVTPAVANAATTAVSRLLKLTELTHKFGTADGQGRKRLEFNCNKAAGKSRRSA